MGADNANPLNELKDLGRQIDGAAHLEDLKPIYARIDQLAKFHSGDLDVQLTTDELKQKIVERGRVLRKAILKEERSATPVPPQISRPVEEAPHQDESIPTPPPPMPVPAEIPAVEPMQASVPVAKPAAMAPAPQQKKTGRPGALAAGILVGVLLAIGGSVVLINQARKRNLASVQVKIASVPSGASIQVNGEQKCTSDCTLDLPPGNYQVTAFLDGYEPAASSVTIQPGKSASLAMALEPARQSLRILTDLPQGKVTVDDQPPIDLQDGQFVLEKIPLGAHSVGLKSATGEATFTVTVEEAKLPTITGPIVARNLMAVAVASMGGKARAYGGGSPLKLVLNGQEQGVVGPDGLDLAAYQPGVSEFVVGEGKDQKTVSETFGPSPALTVFLKSDLNIGTLIVTAGEEDVRVFVNDKESARKTKRGQVRIPAIGNVTVRVAKDGFDPVQPQVVEVKKGAEARVEFKLQASPKFATLLLRGATPGAEVVLDQKSIGTVGDDGSFTNNAVAPGDHTIELRRDQYLPRRTQRSFRAGQSITIADVLLTSALGTVRVARTPADAAVSFRRADETQARELTGAQVQLAPGAYVFTARAPGFVEKSERVQVSPGESHAVELALAKAAVAPPPPPKAFGMSDFENPSSWSQQGDIWAHRGGGFVPFKAVPNGTFNFTIQLLKGGNLFRGAKIRWVMQYLDAKNYDLFELDRKSLTSKVVINGKTFDRGKFDHNLSEKDKSYTIQLDSRREHLVTRFQVNGEWKTIDSWDEADRDFTAGRFAFLVQGSDEIGLSDFKFTPR